jgi:hypothetical protein
VFDKLGDEILGRRCSEGAIEMEDKEMGHAQIADQRDLMLSRRQQMRRIIGPQHFHRVRVEGHDDCGAAGFLRVVRRSGNNSLVPEMDAVENADGKKERAGKLRKSVDRAKDVHENAE